MERDRYDNGVPSWVDLGCPDVAAAAEFYGGLFGWDVEIGPPETGGYGIAHLKGRPVAGLGPQQNPGPPVWTTYVNVDDAEAAAAAFTANGGQVIVPPMDVMDQGRMAVFVDAVGAFISVWQPLAHTGAGLVNEPGTLSWNELLTDDLDGAIAFYGAVFGWEAAVQGPPGGPPAYVEFKLNGAPVAGMMPRPPDMPAEVPPFWGVYFAVADTDESLARLTELGGSVMMGPMDIEPGRFAVVADPAGAVFNIITLSEALAG